jgi:hypothetical protein
MGEWRCRYIVLELDTRWLHVPEVATDTRCVGGWTDPRTGLYITEKRILHAHVKNRIASVV